MFYDDNRITIEGDTAIAFSENVEARYEAYGWHVQHVDFTNGGTTYEENVEASWRPSTTPRLLPTSRLSSVSPPSSVGRFRSSPVWPGTRCEDWH